MSIFVIDVGTSSMRGILYDEHANILLKKQLLHCPDYKNNGCVEQKPEIWQTGLYQLCRSLYEFCENCKEPFPMAISITSQRSSVIPLDENGKPLADAIMWQDQRTLPYVEKFCSCNDMIFKRTGSPLNPIFSGCKMSWIAEN